VRSSPPSSSLFGLHSSLTWIRQEPIGFIALVPIISVLPLTENVSACTLPPNTYAYPGECVLYNLDGTTYEEPENAPKPKAQPQAENQDKQPRHSYPKYMWTPFSYRYSHYPFGHHYYPRYSLGLHFWSGHFGHHRSHH